MAVYIKPNIAIRIVSYFMIYKWKLFYYLLSKLTHNIQDAVLCVMFWWKERHDHDTQWYKIYARTMTFPLPWRDDFVSVYCHSKPIECLMHDDVSLYTIDTKYAYFVQTDPSVNLYDSNTSPFLFVAQNTHAQYLIKVSHAHFIQYASQMKSESMNITLLSSTGRCGSTILTQMFESTEQILSISEPHAMFAYIEITQPTSRQLLSSILQMDCKPRKSFNQGCIVKTKSQCVSCVREIARSLPHVKHIFLYRNGLETVGSFNHAFSGIMPKGTPRPKTLTKTLMILHSLAALFPQYQTVLFDHVTCLDTFWAWYWTCHIAEYLKIAEDGTPITSVHYDDLIMSPDQVFSKLLRFCGYSEELTEKGCMALSKDSQRGLNISRESVKSRTDQSPFQVYEDPDTRIKCDAICDTMKVPRLSDKHFRLPNDLLD